MKMQRNSLKLMLKKVRTVLLLESCPIVWQICERNCCCWCLISDFNIICYFPQNQHCLSLHQRGEESVDPNHQSNIEVNKTYNVQYCTVFFAKPMLYKCPFLILFIYLFIKVFFICISQVRVLSSSGSSFLSFLSMLNAQT